MDTEKKSCNPCLKYKDSIYLNYFSNNFSGDDIETFCETYFFVRKECQTIHMTQISEPQSNPLVSVIVPIFNAEKYLNDCISSILNQTYESMEILLIDDGSTDRSAAICDEFAQIDSRVRVFHNSNLGVSSARNCGIDNSKGDYIVFVDSDDICCNKLIGALVNGILTNHSELVVSGIQIFYDNLLNIIRTAVEPPASLNREQYIRNILIKVCTGQFCGAPYSKLYVSNIVKEQNIRFDTSMEYAEDFCFNMDYLKAISNITVLGEAYYLYRKDTPNSLTSQNYSKIKKEVFWSQRICAYKKYESVFDGLIQKNISLARKVHGLLADYAISAIKMYCKYSDNKEDTIEHIQKIVFDPYIYYRLTLCSISKTNILRIFFMRKKLCKCLYYYETVRYRIGKVIGVVKTEN